MEFYCADMNAATPLGAWGRSVIGGDRASDHLGQAAAERQGQWRRAAGRAAGRTSKRALQIPSIRVGTGTGTSKHTIVAPLQEM